MRGGCRLPFIICEEGENAGFWNVTVKKSDGIPIGWREELVEGTGFDEENGVVQPVQTGLVDVSFKVNIEDSNGERSPLYLELSSLMA